MNLQPRPLICTFQELAAAMEPLHQGNKAHLASLHDVWKMGAPTPQSIVRDPKHFDERLHNPVNHVARIVLPTPLARWIQEVAAVRGMNITYATALNVALSDY